MGTWWLSLSLMQQIFYTIAITSSVVLIVQIILNLIGLSDEDLGMEGLSDTLEALDDAAFDGGDTGLGLLSVRTILAFLMGFGWGGVVLAGMHGHPLLVAFGAFIAGSVFMFTVFWLMRQMFRLTDSGNITLDSAAGKTGTVYLPIPPQRSGMGQVQVVIQGRLRELPAVTDAPETLPTGIHISVVQVIEANVLLVQSLKED
ncbi:MAG: hypothetical protein RBT47_03500 [Anaerolineae bacterium]|jgi:hypothetical protein|nr:hypothetical protein [Anaerolineae bacterium]